MVRETLRLGLICAGETVQDARKLVDMYVTPTRLQESLLAAVALLSLAINGPALVAPEAEQAAG